MMPEEKLQEASVHDIVKTILGCEEFIKIAIVELERRGLKWPAGSKHGS